MLNNNNFLLSVLLNVIFYIIISVLLYKIMVHNERADEDPGYFKFVIVLAIIWPFSMLYLIFDNSETVD